MSKSKPVPGPKTDQPDLETPTRESPTTDEERIDESVDESFPASDPPAVHVGTSSAATRVPIRPRQGAHG